VSNVTKICLVGIELIQTGGQTDREVAEMTILAVDFVYLCVWAWRRIWSCCTLLHPRLQCISSQHIHVGT